MFKDGRILYSEVPSNAIYEFKKGSPPSVFKRPAGCAYAKADANNCGSNGLAVDGQNRLLICDEGNRAVSRLDESNFTVEILCSNYRGRRFNSPNDVVVSADGGIFFTDPPYGLKGGFKSADRETGFNGVYLLRPGGEPELLDATLNAPNGIALSPDGGRLYVSQSGDLDPGWYVYDVSGGKLEGRRKFCSPSADELCMPGSPDGMCVAPDGLIYASGPGGIWIFSAVLEPLGRIGFDFPVSNCCLAVFDGVEYLFTTGRGDAYLLETEKICRAVKR